MTAAVNVPLNNALAAADPGNAGAGHRYHARWTAWNHMRALSSAVAAILLTVTAG